MKLFQSSTPSPTLQASRDKNGPISSSLHNSQSSPELFLSGEDMFESAVLPMFARIKMKATYWEEALNELDSSEHYLSDEEREHYAFKHTDRFYRDSQENVLHGAYMYVLLPNDRLYGLELGSSGKFFHSYLSSGSPVKAAGVIYCLNGRIITVSNESGHYKPTYDEMLPALLSFQTQSPTPLVFEDHSQVNENLPNQGVRHFQVETLNNWIHCSLIKELDSLKAIIVANADEAEKAGHFGLSSIVSAQPILSFYNDSEEMKEQIELLPNDSYMTQTCLARMKDPNYHSRFLGKRKV